MLGFACPSPILPKRRAQKIWPACVLYMMPQAREAPGPSPRRQGGGCSSVPSRWHLWLLRCTLHNTKVVCFRKFSHMLDGTMRRKRRRRRRRRSSAHGSTRCLTTTSLPSILGGVRNRHSPPPRQVPVEKRANAAKISAQGRQRRTKKHKGRE